MDVSQSDREKYLAAKAHVAALKGFYIHLIVFLAVMIGLGAIDFASGGTWWVQWPLAGWGLGVLFHAYLVFFPHALTTSGWEERKIKETMAKM